MFHNQPESYVNWNTSPSRHSCRSGPAVIFVRLAGSTTFLRLPPSPPEWKLMTIHRYLIERRFDTSFVQPEFVHSTSCPLRETIAMNYKGSGGHRSVNLSQQCFVSLLLSCYCCQQNSIYFAVFSIVLFKI